MPRRPISWLIPLVAVALIGTAAAIGLGQDDEPAAVQDLERVQSAGERAGDAGQRIIENLERIEANLKEGAGLSDKTGEIHELTTKQRESLERLATLLRGQLQTLRSTKESLEGARRSASDLKRLGREQLVILRRTVAAVRSLRSDAEFATRTSGELSQLALYGARLAEDSQRRFGGP
ncbi:MAG TPA: hypothetical protein VNP73_07640 [Actinomycetota bacterium]|nr:hypothetical protein [Actinomycetota bacterium]